MFIAIIGTRSSGKSTIEDYLVKYKGFIPLRLSSSSLQDDHTASEQVQSTPSESDLTLGIGDALDTSHFSHQRFSFLSLASPLSPSLPSPAPDLKADQSHPFWFSSPEQLLHHVTHNWRTNFVTIDLDTQDRLELFGTRPFFLVISVDAPLLIRYRRSIKKSQHRVSLENFILEHDLYYYGLCAAGPKAGKAEPDLSFSQHSFHGINQYANLHVLNPFESVSEFHDHLNSLDLSNTERLRPGWDAYFMQLASLASRRSNCMKRRVGAILVRNKRILATGYNGTPRGLTNCNDGGCARCNSGNETLDGCLCLHAEENALLEAGRERVGDGAVLYCNTCPCLTCTIKIIQTGIKEVVYNLTYKVDDASAALFAEAGVVLRRHAMPS